MKDAEFRISLPEKLISTPEDAEGWPAPAAVGWAVTAAAGAAAAVTVTAAAGAAAGRLARTSRRLRLRLAQNWPWAADITAAITRMQAISSG